MRVCTLMLAGFAMVAAGAPAAAQNATRTVDDYVCTFAGKCGDDAQKSSTDDSIEAPETKGMSLARKSRPADQKAAVAPRSSATAAPTASAPARGAVRQANRAPAAQSKRAPQRLASASTTTSRKATAGTRADLRVSFLLNSAELTAQAKAEAKVFAEALRRPELANKRFRIEGHTDASGPRSLNLSLSERRAAAVAEYLSSLGVPRNRFEVRGYGPDRPLDGRNAESPDNRRVEALLL